MSSCTFLKVGNKYINPDHIISFQQVNDEYLEIKTTDGILRSGVEMKDFINMLQQSNWFIKSYE